MIDMNRSKYLDILDEDVGAWNELVRNNPDMVPDFTGADLSDADLTGVNFSNAVLDNADLSGAALCGGILCGASLVNARLSGADISDADLSDADMSGANLRGTFIPDANLARVNLPRADLYKATLKHSSLLDASFQDCNLADADLSGALLNGTCFKNAILDGADFTGANLTGACFLFYNEQKEGGSSIAMPNDPFRVLNGSPGWIVDNVKCDYIYLDALKHVRCPMDRDFEPREFEHALCPVATLEYDFEQNASWFAPVILHKLVSDLNRENKKMGLELLSVTHRRNGHRAVFSLNARELPADILSLIRIRHEALLEKIENANGNIDLFLKHADMHL